MKNHSIYFPFAFSPIFWCSINIYLVVKAFHKLDYFFIFFPIYFLFEVRQRERERVCVWERERERECVCERERSLSIKPVSNFDQKEKKILAYSTIFFSLFTNFSPFDPSKLAKLKFGIALCLLHETKFIWKKNILKTPILDVSLQ